MKKPVIYCDIDGVVLNFCEGLRLYLQKKGITFYPQNVTSYNFDGDIGCCKKDIYSSFYDLELYKVLPFTTNAEESMKKLISVGDVYAYTHCVDKIEIFNERHKVCSRLGMKGIPYIATKKKPIQDVDVLFDDCLGVHEDWINAGTETRLYLIDAPYNQETNENKSSPAWGRVIRCKNFAEAVDDYILFLEGKNEEK